MKTYTELRYDLLELAKQKNEFRLKIAELQREESAVVTSLIEAAGRYFTQSLDEKDQDGALRKDLSPELQAVVEHVKPFKRACSICREPGHRSTSCPRAHEAREEEKAEAEEKPRRRRRRKK